MLTIWREGDVSEVAVAFPVEAPVEPRADVPAEEAPPG
jgi:hypothetical protein